MNSYDFFSFVIANLQCILLGQYTVANAWCTVSWIGGGHKPWHLDVGFCRTSVLLWPLPRHHIYNAAPFWCSTLTGGKDQLDQNHSAGCWCVCLDLPSCDLIRRLDRNNAFGDPPQIQSITHANERSIRPSQQIWLPPRTRRSTFGRARGRTVRCLCVRGTSLFRHTPYIERELRVAHGVCIYMQQLSCPRDQQAGS